LTGELGSRATAAGRNGLLLVDSVWLFGKGRHEGRKKKCIKQRK